LPAALALLAAASAAFAPAPAPPPLSRFAAVAEAPPADPETAREAATLERLVAQLTQEIETVRRQRHRFKVKVSLLDEDAFARSLRRRAAAALSQVSAERPAWLAFDLARPDASPDSPLDEDDPSVPGFYDPASRALVVRRHLQQELLWEDGAGLRRLLSRELAHALQDQNTGLGLKGLDPDAALARRALLEGDATLTALALEARQAGLPLPYLLAEQARALRSPDSVKLLRASGLGGGLARLPRLAVEALTLPYLQGFALASDLYQRGGFALVDQAFAHPPQTSLQLLSPKAYLAGLPPLPLETPPPPPGKVVARGRLGALGLEEVLAVCIDADIALEHARRWLGDSYVVTASGPNRLALVWQVALQSEAAARAMANALEMQRPCWNHEPGDAPEREPSISGDASILQEDNRVVLVRGLAPAKAAVLARKALWFLAEVPPPLPPLGPLAEEGPADARDERAAGRFTSKRLGLTALVPPGMEEVTAGGQLFAVAGHGFLGGLDLGLQRFDDDARRRLLARYQLAALAQVPSGLSLPQPSQETASLLGQRVQEQVWVDPKSGFLLRMGVVELCGGRAFLAVTRLGFSSGQLEVLQPWLAGMKLDSLAPPICQELRPK
jgi:hypothetical protein